MALDWLPSAPALPPRTYAPLPAVGSFRTAPILPLIASGHTIVVPGINFNSGVGFPSVTSSGARLYVYINGVDRTSYTRGEAVDITRQMGARATAKLRMYDAAGSARPERGQEIRIIDHSRTMFAGLITQVVGECPKNHTADFYYDVDCADFSVVCDWRTVTATYPAGSITKNIYWDIVDNFLDGENITHFGVDGFDTIDEEITFSKVTVTEALNRLRDATGEDWRIGWNKDLVTHVYASWSAAPFSITDSSRNWRNLKVTWSVEGYRNVQHVRSNFNLTVGTRTETYTADGSQWTFPTQFVLRSAPTVTVNGVSAAVYEMDVDPWGQTGFYWFRGGAGIFYYPQTPFAVGTTIVITYGSFFSNVVTAKSDAQISARAAIEGRSGIYENVEEVRDITTDDAGLQIANGLLTRSGSMPTKIECEVDTPGLDPGMLVTVTISAFGLSASYICTKITSKLVATKAADLGEGGQFRHNIELSSNLDQGAGMRYFERLIARTRQGLVAPAPEVHGWDLAESGELELGSDWTDIDVAPVYFQNTGLLSNTNAIAGTPPDGQDLYLRILKDGVTIYAASLSSNLRIPDSSAAIAAQATFDPSPCTVLGTVRDNTAANVFTIQGKYVATSGPIVNAQRVHVQMFLKY
jgi:hypothetical protein